MITKINLVNAALSLAGLTSRSNPPTDEMVEKGLVSLELLMAGLKDKSDLSFNEADDIFESEANDDSGITPSQSKDVVEYISVHICESLAAPFTGDLKQMSRRAYRKLLSKTPAELANSENLPKGQGNMRCGGWGWVSPYIAPEKKGDESTDTAE